MVEEHWTFKRNRQPKGGINARAHQQVDRLTKGGLQWVTIQPSKREGSDNMDKPSLRLDLYDMMLGEMSPSQRKF